MHKDTDRNGRRFPLYTPGGKEKYSGREKIKLTVNIKTENLEGPGVAIALRCDGPEVNGQIQFSQFVTSQGTIPIKGTKDWTKYTVELDQKVRPGIETINVYFLYLEDTSGTVYFDDASLIY